MKVDKDKNQIYGQLIVDLANAKTVEEGISKLIENIQKSFDFSKEWVIREKAWLLNSRHGEYDKIEFEKIIEKVKRFLHEFVKERNVSKTEDFTDFIITYEHVAPHKLLVLEDGSIITKPPFEESVCIYRQIIYFVLASFFLIPRNRELLNKCKECDKFYLSKRLLKKKKARFCSDKCKSDWHNRKRINSGEAKLYKRKKRLEGKYQ